MSRSFLFTPANHARRVEKALASAADAVILDLEDAVAVTEKPAARPLAVAAASRPRAGRLYVRVNPADTPFCYADLLAVTIAGLDGIVLPKVESPAQLQTVDWLLLQLERERGLSPGGIDLIPIIETARGLNAIGPICAAGTRSRRAAFGAGDYTLDLGLTWTAHETELLPARSAIVLASRAHGWDPPVDTVWVDLADAAGMAASARRARELGFSGKLCIHPDQLAPTHAGFAPTPAELAHARAVVAAFAAAEAAGSASIRVNGAFVDYPVVQRAQRIIESAGPSAPAPARADTTENHPA